MSIAINKDKCVGCRKCSQVCPGSLIKLDENNMSLLNDITEKYMMMCVNRSLSALEFYKGLIG